VEVCVDGLRFGLTYLRRGEAVLRVSGGADERVTDSDAFFRDRHPVLRPQPAHPDAEQTLEPPSGGRGSSSSGSPASGST
jgi:hypothetical protein